MQGFIDVFNKAEVSYHKFLESNSKEKLFSEFRSHHDIYGFIHNCDNPPESASIQIAQQINNELYNKYLNINENKPIIGYDGGAPSVHCKFNELDTRHIMMSVIINTYLPEKVKHIVEIGGGFGNWLRLNYLIMNTTSWSIIDLPHLNELQNWCLEKYNVPKDKYTTISAYNYMNFANTCNNIDLVIGSHSLSEFSYDVFMNYFFSIITKSKYFFYAYHIASPNPFLISKKNEAISQYFDVIIDIPSESNNVRNVLLKNKNI